jgi:hypothetical protein
MGAGWVGAEALIEAGEDGGYLIGAEWSALAGDASLVTV